MHAFVVIIPARYQSSRLPGKPLREIAGKPMIAHVIDRAKESGADDIVVATDHTEIAKTVRSLGTRVCMTRDDHISGTDRLAEVVIAEQFADDQIVVNLQGDEPLMPAALLEQVVGLLDNEPRAAIATLSTAIPDSDALNDPSVVKVVTANNGRALYFSRAPIPWDREGNSPAHVITAQRHLGLYAYRANFLKRYNALPPSPLEQLEHLEQLRALQAGDWIQVAQANCLPGPGVDTFEDLLKVEAKLQ